MARWKAVGSLAVVFALIFVFAGVIIAASMPEVMVLKAPYEKTRGPVEFTHQKHIDDYQIGCGECHHDAKGQPLTDLQPGDPVQSCLDCHSKPGEIRGKEARELTPEQRRAYHGNAMHDNCIGCHREYNKTKDNRPAPTVCKDCHGS